MLSVIRIGFVSCLLLSVVKFPFLPSKIRAKYIVKLLKLGGPAFVKLGQSLAVRVDIVGEDVAESLRHLQDQMPSFSYSKVQKEIQQSFGKSIEDIFDTFNSMPVAAASIAQVHFAKTKTGEEVAVKILRPNIAKEFKRDVKAFHFYATILERLIPSIRRLRPVQVVSEMQQWVDEELNLENEAKNAVRLANNFKDSNIFAVPKVHQSLTTKSVLTTERVYGIRIDDKQGIIEAGLDPKDILEKSATIFFLQVFRDGFFHADMHPGNMFIRSDGVLCPVDFGIMGYLTKDTRIYVADIMYYLVLQEYEKAAQVHFNAGYVPSTQSLSAFTEALASIGGTMRNKGDWQNTSMGTLLSDLFDTTKKFSMKTRPELLLLQKTMVVAEGVGRTIESEQNMWLLIRPTMEMWMRVNRGVGARIEQKLNEVITNHKNSA